ncbi:MAG: DUF3089 domain-containing protein [Polyangiales bacterium]
MKPTVRLTWLSVLTLFGCSASATDDALEPSDVPETAAQEASTPGAKADAYNPFPGYKSEVYASDKMWMCKPGLANNACTKGLDAIESLPDGKFQKVAESVGTTHPVDCLYWYPTVNRTEEPTSLDFSDPTPMLDALRTQASRFSRVCNVYAPFYRQTSLNRGGDRVIAYKDVVDSFKHYLANHSEGRDFVLLGHSQGSGHLTNLMKELFDNDPALRKRLISALPIGSGVTVKTGDVVGGTFKNIPLCTSGDQLGCVITYRSYAASAPPTSNGVANGLQSACTNPAQLNGKGKLFSGSYFYARPTAFMRPSFGAEFTEPFALFRNLFEGECVVDRQSGASYLAIAYHKDPADKRREYVDLTPRTGGGMGLHIVDYHFAVDDLLEIVSKQIAARAAGK